MDSIDANQISNDNMGFFLDLVHEIQKTPFGEINFTLITHRGKAAAVVSNEFRTKKYGNEKNAEALKDIIALIKQMSVDKKTGTFSFSLAFQDGSIRGITHQYYNKKNYT